MRLETSLAAGLTALALSTTALSTATVSFERFGGPSTLGVAQPGRTIVESFDGAATTGGSRVAVNTDARDRTVGNLFRSAVGEFRGLGGTGGGSSVTGNADQIQIRSGDNAGRFNVPEQGGTFLDSNDTLGFSWTIANTASLRRRSSPTPTTPASG